MGIMAAVLALVLAAVILRQRLATFAAQRPQDYAGGAPEVDIRRHLNGALICDGAIFGPMGRVTSRFTATMTGTWDGDRGVLDEVFRYDTGTEQRRAWTLTLLPGGAIRAEASDLIGTGTGAQSGPAVLLSYRIVLPPSAGGHVLDVRDWMYLTPGGTLVNRSQFRKFGIMVAELVATIRPAGVQGGAVSDERRPDAEKDTM